MPHPEVMIVRNALARAAAVDALEEAVPDNERVERLSSYKAAHGILGGADSDPADAELIAALAEAVVDLKAEVADLQEQVAKLKKLATTNTAKKGVKK